MRECFVLLHNVVLQENIHDTWRWLLDPAHGYTVREAYCFLTNNGNFVDRMLVDDIWHKQIPSKVTLFVWCLLRNRHPTKDNLVRRRVIQVHDSDCVAGCSVLETANHLFTDCNIFNSLWAQVLHWLGISSVLSGNIRQHFMQFSNMPGLPRATHSFLKTIWFASVWDIWKERNNRVFQNMACDSSIIVEKVKLNSFLWLKSSQVLFSYSYHEWWKHLLPCMGVQV